MWVDRIHKVKYDEFKDLKKNTKKEVLTMDNEEERHITYSVRVKIVTKDIAEIINDNDCDLEEKTDRIMSCMEIGITDSEHFLEVTGMTELILEMTTRSIIKSDIRKTLLKLQTNETPT